MIGAIILTLAFGSLIVWWILQDKPDPEEFRFERVHTPALAAMLLYTKVNDLEREGYTIESMGVRSRIGFDSWQPYIRVKPEVKAPMYDPLVTALGKG